MSKFARIALLALGFLLILSWFQPDQTPSINHDVLITVDSEVPIGKTVILTIGNNSQDPLQIASNCPNNPLRVEQLVNGQWLKKEAASKQITCDSEEVITIPPDASEQISYASWNQDLFGEVGTYKIHLDAEIEGEQRIYSVEINVERRGIFRWIGQEVLYKPILNALVFFISILPGRSLGLAIILLTLVIKLILLIPSQRGLKAQKQIQKIQPQLDALKKKYQSDPQKLTAETMKIYKKHKVNPMSSCLPLLIQLPIILALFYVIRDGVETINPQALYGGLAQFDITSINPHFVYLDLTQINWTVLPLLIGGLQFIQMKLTIGKTMKKQGDQKGNPMAGVSKVMVYIMPLFLVFVAATFPAGLSVYWGTSTLFSIGQQIIVNRSK